MECDHNYKYIKDVPKIAKFNEETIEIPVKCKNCGKTAREIWIFSCYVED